MTRLSISFCWAHEYPKYIVSSYSSQPMVSQHQMITMISIRHWPVRGMRKSRRVGLPISVYRNIYINIYFRFHAVLRYSSKIWEHAVMLHLWFVLFLSRFSLYSYCHFITSLSILFAVDKTFPALSFLLTNISYMPNNVREQFWEAVWTWEEAISMIKDSCCSNRKLGTLFWPGWWWHDIKVKIISINIYFYQWILGQKYGCPKQKLPFFPNLHTLLLVMNSFLISKPLCHITDAITQLIN